MSVEIVESNDVKAPILKPFGPMKKVLIGILVISLLVGLKSGILGFIITFVLLYFIGMLGLQMFMVITSNNGVISKVHNYYKNLAVQNGLEVTYEALGIVIDDKNKKIAFTLDPQNQPRLTVCDYGDIRQWYTKENEVQSNRDYKLHKSGRISGGNKTIFKANFITVTINNPEQPMYGFKVKNQNDAEMWMARLDSLLNG